MNGFQRYRTDFLHLFDAVVRAGSFRDPIAFHPSYHEHSLTYIAKRGPLLPIDGVLHRSWHTGRHAFGANVGMRMYSLSGISFARCEANTEKTSADQSLSIYVCERSDYPRLYREYHRKIRSSPVDHPPPVMPDEAFDRLRQHSLRFLERDNLTTIRQFGGRPKRGILLTGPPGNGKTSVCRWLRDEAIRSGLETQDVGPDAYQAARRNCNPVAAVKELFSVTHRGIIFFDDMDMALRDRTIAKESDDQAVFLGALDGMTVVEGVVYVFTTNCPLNQIDPAFKRPGRIDLVIPFERPDAAMRSRLFERWNGSIRAVIPIERMISETDGFSFAELEELRNLLVLRYIDQREWAWDWAMEQFKINRTDLRIEVLDEPRS